MAELREIRRGDQVPGKPVRRWFTSPDLDLIVWCDEASRPTGFQLCYDKLRSERALTWKPETGFLHMAVDDGESDVGLRHKSAPVLVDDGHFDARRIIDLFLASSHRLPAEIASFVEAGLRQYPTDGHET